MEQYYQPELPDTGRIILREDEERHLLKVRRARSGEHFRCTDGRGKIADVLICCPNGRTNIYSIGEIARVPPPSPLIHLAVALPRQEARVEWLLEKAVELGTKQITPLITERGIRERIRTDRMEKIMISALKQSLSAHLPVLNTATGLADFLLLEHPQILLAHCIDAPKTLIGSLKLMPEVTLMIGPEGDFTSEEVEAILKKNAAGISLGELRLRTETAVLVALAHIRQNHQLSEAHQDPT
ncbi:MAG: 16S rRNA (uracil(1498)-N(3))-methyltransferase [Sphingomonadales bacterium]|nr:16S rRNA (uracil(1498)-N(3))-methyltransferase [Sphingomonadales bacterium]